MTNILGLVIPEMTQDKKQAIDDLIQNRERLRKEKQFEEADKITKLRKIKKISVKKLGESN